MIITSRHNDVVLNVLYILEKNQTEKNRTDAMDDPNESTKQNKTYFSHLALVVSNHPEDVEFIVHIGGLGICLTPS